jgi:Domain of unknown function (DUF397)
VGAATAGGRFGRPRSHSRWFASSLSFSNGDCVEVASQSDVGAGIRHSKDSPGSVLSFTSDAWLAFLDGVREGEFDYRIKVARSVSGTARHPAGPMLDFTKPE